MRRGGWRRCLLRLLWCLAVYGCLWGFFAAGARAGGFCRGCTARFARPLTAAEVTALRESAAVRPTFWAQRAVTLECPAGAVSVAALAYNGDPYAVWEAEYRGGGAPAAWDGAAPQAAVSDALAWQLWGGVDATGLTLALEGELYTVTGTFAAAEALVLYPAAPDAGFTAAEFCGDLGRADPVDTVQGWLDTADVPALLVADPRAAPGLAAAALAGLLALAVWFVARQNAVGPPRLPRGAGRWLAWGGALLAALCLPALLERLPLWLIPDRWSRFAFWGDLAAALRGRLGGWLALAPAARDIARRWLLLRQAAALAGLALLLFPLDPFATPSGRRTP